MAKFIPSKGISYDIKMTGVYFNTVYNITLTTFKTVPKELTKHKNVKFMLRALEMTSVFEYASVIFHVSANSGQLPDETAAPADKYLLMVKINGYEEVIESVDLEFLLELADQQDRVARIIQPIGSRDKHIFEFPQTDQWGMETTEQCTLQRTWSVYAYDLTIGSETRSGNVRNLAEYLFKRYTHGPIG
jgi:hypothetical protein